MNSHVNQARQTILCPDKAVICHVLVIQKTPAMGKMEHKYFVIGGLSRQSARGDRFMDQKVHLGYALVVHVTLLRLLSAHITCTGLSTCFLPGATQRHYAQTHRIFLRKTFAVQHANTLGKAIREYVSSPIERGPDTKGVAGMVSYYVLGRNIWDSVDPMFKTADLKGLPLRTPRFDLGLHQGKIVNRPDPCDQQSRATCVDSVFFLDDEVGCEHRRSYLVTVRTIADEGVDKAIAFDWLEYKSCDIQAENWFLESFETREEDGGLKIIWSSLVRQENLHRPDSDLVFDAIILETVSCSLDLHSRNVDP
ncbi:hypothetical protein KCU89_g135, partial [Aureobasidium melanogenum]